MNKLHIEADFYGLLSLQHAIDDRMLQVQGHDDTVVLSIDGWARIRGQVRGDGGFSTWGWLEQSGNPQIIKPNPTFPLQYIIGETGTYLMFVRVLCSPHYRVRPSQGYSGIYDEFATVKVGRRATAPQPSMVLDFGIIGVLRRQMHLLE